MTRSRRFALLLSLSLASLTAACDGGSDDGPSSARAPSAERPTTNAPVTNPADEEPRVEPQSRVPLGGRVVDAVDGVALAGVSVTLSDPRDARALATRETGVDGRYAFTNVARDVPLELRLTAPGYRSERVGLARGAPGGAAPVQTVRLVSDDNAGVGSAAGRISGLDGEGLGGLNVAFVRGAGVSDATPLVTTTTAADGSWSIEGLDYGNWVCIVYGPGYPTSYTTVTVLGGIALTDLEGVALPALAADEIAIVASRDAAAARLTTSLTVTPIELDETGTGLSGLREEVSLYNSYPSRPTSREVSAGRPYVLVVRLSEPGTLRYILSTSPLARTTFAETGARVRVVGADGLLAEYAAPDIGGGIIGGTTWTVFELDLDDGGIRTRDRVF